MQWKLYEVNNNELSMETFFLSVNNLRIHMHQFIKMAGQKYGLQGQELVFLMAIDHMDHPTVGELSKKLNVQQANVSKMIRALELQDLIVKEKDLVDTRSFRLSLSAKAIGIKEETHQNMRAHYNKHHDSVDVEVMNHGVQELIKFIQLFEKSF